ncbi:MAG TPA: ATP synthase F1 subunit delta [Longimicrobium sp.]|jgi:F-type H+-transporting ATPase subunit delta|nr:ATP synthase F1 subunit delta [Longimicrobium sp.]
MRAEIIARNYADTLLELARRHGGQATVQEFGAAMELLADSVAEPRVREFLSSPRIPAAERKDALRGALEGRVPDLFLRFVMLVVDKRRQRLLGEIAHEYRALVDEQAGRVRVQVQISHAPDEALRNQVANALASRLGKDVVATFTVDPDLLGGMVVRYGDEILDGSVRTGAENLRRRMVAATMARQTAAA